MLPHAWLLAAVLAVPAGSTAAPSPVQDPVRVSAALTRDRVAVGEATTLQVTVDTRGDAVDDIRLPPLPPGIDILGTSDFTQTQLSVPGGRSRLTRRDVLLSPRAPGTYRIDPVTVVVQGRSYRTAALTLRVTPGGAGSGARVPGASAGGPVTSLVLELSADTVYVGEQVLLEAEVTFVEEFRTRNSRPASFEPPAPQGFWVQDLPDPVTVALRVRDGRTVESQTYRRAYFPLAAGEFAFPPAHLHYDLRRGFLNPPETRRISSDSARLVVLPLPAPGRPASFAGAVGRVAVRASVRPSRIAVGEAAVVEVELDGVGNVKGMPEPSLPPLVDVEVFAPTQESEVRVERDRVGGTKRFRWVVVPQAPGALRIPPIEYSYFDPELKQYVQLRTEPLEVVAEPGDGAPARRVAADTALRPLRLRPATAPADWARTPAFGALQLVPLLLVGATLLTRRRRDREPGPADHARRLRRELAELRGRRDDGAALLELERIVRDAARCLAGLEAGEDVVEGLRRRQRPQAAGIARELLRDAQHARYAPGPARVSLADMVAAADRLIVLLAPARRRWPRAGAVLLLALLAGAAGVLAVAGFAGAGQDGGPADRGSSHAGVAAAASAFDEGVSRYQAQDFAGAANSFHGWVREHPRDPAGWHNLGVAAFRAGDPGRAVWAWLRGVRAAPRDADLLHNLRLAGAAAAVPRVRPADRLAAGERLVVAAMAWWILALSAAAWSRSPVARGLAGAAVLALVLLGGAAAVPSLGPRWVTPLRAGAPLYAGPAAGDQPAGELQVGSLARVVDRRNGWLLVAAGANGRAWVERAAVAAP